MEVRPVLVPEEAVVVVRELELVVAGLVAGQWLELGASGAVVLLVDLAEENPCCCCCED